MNTRSAPRTSSRKSWTSATLRCEFPSSMRVPAYTGQRRHACPIVENHPLMTRATVRSTGAAVLLAGPTALAFFSGGYFDEPRLWAAIGAFVLVLVAALVSDRALPQSWPGRLALASLAGLVAWTALSIGWAPLAGPAFHDVQRLLLYLAALVAAAALLRGWATAEAIEPALAAGSLIVISYGPSGRLLPGLVPLDSSLSA